MSSVRERINDYFLSIEREAEMLDPPETFDEAIIGVSENPFGASVVVYDRKRVIKALTEKMGMSEEVASEHYEFNILGSAIGETSPIFVDSSILEFF